MTQRPILIFPDRRLSAKAEDITRFDETTDDLAQDLFNTMYAAPGIGLAANQIGIPARMFVMDCSAKDDAPDPRVLINPKVLWSSDDKETHEEGCLSFPEQYANVTRPVSVEVKFQNVVGDWREEKFEGLASRCVQHEIDHLDGILFVDRVSMIKRRMIVRRMEKRKRRGGGD